MKIEEKQILLRISLAAILLLALSLLPLEGLLRLTLFLVPYLIIGWDILWNALRNIVRGQVFDENFLMALATVGAFCIGEYPEGVFVMLFYQVGEFFQRRAVDRSRGAISDLMNLMPEYANLEAAEGLRQVDPFEVEVDQIIVIKPGEKIPLDGVVIEGSSSVNTMALTGEAAPRDVDVGDALISGCVNMTGLLRLRVTQRFEDSTVSKILELVENSASSKAKTESFITRFAKYYTPFVVLTALALAVFPSLLWGNWSVWIYRSLSFLVISCPCALVLSVPLSFFGGIGGASRQGILIKGSTYLEALAQAEVLAFDKTGTLTTGRFSVVEIVPTAPWTRETLLHLAAQAEYYNDHPIAISLREAAPKELTAPSQSQVKVLPGKGVEAVMDGRRVSVGNQKLMRELSLEDCTTIEYGTVVYVAVDGSYAGYILLEDQLKESAATALAQLKALGIRKTAMLTGDNAASAHKVSASLSLDEVYAQLLPQDKVSCVETLMKTCSAKGKLVFVGDGINDAPVLTRADVGVAMGAFGSNAAMEAADIVLLDDDPQKLCTVIQIAKKTMQITRQNIVFSLGVKALVLILTIFGLSNMWQAVLADVGVSVLAVINATRTLHFRDISKP